MNSKLFWRIASGNVKRNRQFYTPYFIACVIIVAMFFIIFNMCFSGSVQEVDPGSTLEFMLIFGVVVMCIFTFFFMMYINSFLIKRRKKEFGLYAVLGLEKRHVCKIISIEGFIVNASALGLGLISGLVFGKLMYMCLMAFTHLAVESSYRLSPFSFVVTVVYFLCVFFSNGIINKLQVRLANPADLLKGGQKGEKKARGVVPLAIVGVLLLGTAYAVAILVKNRGFAMLFFWPAVLFVILGTFALFKAGSLLVLRALKKNNKIYYKPKGFINISSLMYRFRQNAAGLSNICILSTMFIVTISLCCALYFGSNTILSTQHSNDLSMSFIFSHPTDSQEKERIAECIEETAKKYNVQPTDTEIFPALNCNFFTVSGGGFVFPQDDGAYLRDNNDAVNYEYRTPFIITLETYNKLCGTNESLSTNEILILTNTDIEFGEVFDTTRGEYKVKAVYPDSAFTVGKNSNSSTYVFMVASDEQAAETLRQRINPKVEGAENAYHSIRVAVNFEGEYEDRVAFASVIAKEIKLALSESARESCNGWELSSIDVERYDNYAFYGGLLFMGIIFSILFLINTVLVMYFKQISEGYDDRTRYVILQKVGMSDEEVRSNINSQVLIVFFLPLVASIFHMLAASNMLVIMLAAFVMTNVKLAITWILITTAAFSIVYAVIFRLTAKTYYKIVKW